MDDVIVAVSSAGHSLEVFGEAYDWLIGWQRNVTSQFGEDGLIEAVFGRIGITNSWCFEVGAADGLYCSNTKTLRDAGWHSVLIEADPMQFAKLESLREPNALLFHEAITQKNFEGLLQQTALPSDADLGVLDIDGMEYWVWEAMRHYRPRVMLVEYAPWNPPGHIPAKDDCGPSDQAGKEAIKALGVSKGYRPICATHCNLLFIRNQL